MRICRSVLLSWCTSRFGWTLRATGFHDAIYFRPKRKSLTWVVSYALMLLCRNVIGWRERSSSSASLARFP